MTYAHRLVHQFVEESSHVLVITDDAEGRAGACRNAGGARKQYEFLPDVEKHLIRQRDVDICSLDLLYVTGEYRRKTTVQSATVSFGHRAGLADHAGSRDSRDNISRPANRGVISKDRGESFDAVDAILKRNHSGVGAYEWARLLACRLGVP